MRPPRGLPERPCREVAPCPAIAGYFVIVGPWTMTRFARQGATISWEGDTVQRTNAFRGVSAALFVVIAAVFAACGDLPVGESGVRVGPATSSDGGLRAPQGTARLTQADVCDDRQCPFVHADEARTGSTPAPARCATPWPEGWHSRSADRPMARAGRRPSRAQASTRPPRPARTSPATECQPARSATTSRAATASPS